MKLKIKVSGSNDDVKLTTNLKKWIELIEEPKLKAIQKRKVLASDEAGGLFEAIITVIIGAPVTVTLVKSIHVWMQEQTKRITLNKKELKITIENESGQRVIIDSKNMNKSDQLFIAELSKSLLAKD